MRQWLMIWVTGIGLFLSIPQDLLALEGEALPSEGEAERATSNISFHGYGELHFNRPSVAGTGLPTGGQDPTFDFHRLVFGWSWQYNDQISLHTEIDFEHAAQEIELEFAYIDYQWIDAVNLRVGSILVPVGYLNEYHEPPNFFSVERPYVQKFIIPTTWGAGGIGLFGQLFPGVIYRIYFVEGLDANEFSENGIKDGRQVLFEDSNKAKNFGGVGRVEYTGLPGLAVGASFYSAGAAQGDPTIGHSQVTLWELDLRYRLKGFDLTGLYAMTRITGADRISAQLLLPDGSPRGTVGSEQFGWYLEGAYHLGRLIAPMSGWDLVPFVRWEEFDTQSKVPAGFPRNPAMDRRALVTGLAYYPVRDIAFKADVEDWKDGTGDKGTRFNLGVAYQF